MFHRVRSFRSEHRRWRALLGLGIVLSAGFLPTGALAAEKGIVPEITWGVDSKTQDRDATAIADLGAKYVRLNISWSDWVEGTRGSYNNSALSNWDRGLALSRQSGAKVIVMVNESPSWARDSSNANAPPRDMADYARFVSFLANRWRGQVAAYEIWNEPNAGGFYVAPDRYAAMLKASAPGIRAADPAAKVMTAGLYTSDYNYFGAVYAAAPDLNNYFDIIGAHPYTNNGAPPDVYWRAANGRISSDTFAAYRELRATVRSHGDDKPVWITEMGWATGSAPWGVSAQQQASNLTLAYKCLEQDPYVQVATTYNLRNNWWANDANDWDSQLGLMTTNFTPKPAYAALKSYTPGGGGCTYRDTSGPTATATTTTNSSSATSAAAAARSARSLSLRLRARKARTARRARAAARGGYVLVTGRAAGRSSGRVQLTFAHRSGRVYRTTYRTTVRISSKGTFSKNVRVPRSGRWRVRATLPKTKTSATISRLAHVTV